LAARFARQIDRLLRGSLKSSGDRIVSGEIWLVEIGSMKPKRLVPGGGYHSPVFMPKTNDILALKGQEIVRLPSTGGAPTTLYAIHAVRKLVGFSQDNADELLIITENPSGRPDVGLLSVSTGSVAPIPYDRTSTEDLDMLEHLLGWKRVYGDKSLYMQHREEQTLSGTVDYVDTFLRADDGEPVNVSNCDGVNCGQPSLSADSTRIVFIRAGEE